MGIRSLCSLRGPHFQLINILTTEELRLGLPKKPLKPRTFIMKPDQTLFLGGLGRLDYTQV